MLDTFCLQCIAPLTSYVLLYATLRWQMNIIKKKPKCWQNNLPEVDYNGNGCLRFVSPNHLKPENQKTPSLLFTFRKWPYPPWRKHGEMAALVSATEKGWAVLTGHHFPFTKQILHTLTSICFVLFVILFLKELFLYLIKMIMCCFFSLMT